MGSTLVVMCEGLCEARLAMGESSPGRMTSQLSNQALVIRQRVIHSTHLESKGIWDLPDATG